MSQRKQNKNIPFPKTESKVYQLLKIEYKYPISAAIRYSYGGILYKLLFNRNMLHSSAGWTVWKEGVPAEVPQKGVGC